jgi:hypothetical protein
MATLALVLSAVASVVSLLSVREMRRRVRRLEAREIDVPGGLIAVRGHKLTRDEERRIRAAFASGEHGPLTPCTPTEVTGERP